MDFLKKSEKCVSCFDSCFLYCFLVVVFPGVFESKCAYVLQVCCMGVFVVWLYCTSFGICPESFAGTGGCQEESGELRFCNFAGLVVLHCVYLMLCISIACILYVCMYVLSVFKLYTSSVWKLLNLDSEFWFDFGGLTTFVVTQGQFNGSLLKATQDPRQHSWRYRSGDKRSQGPRLQGTPWKCHGICKRNLFQGTRRIASLEIWQMQLLPAI